MKATLNYKERDTYGSVVLTPETPAEEESLRLILSNGRMTRCYFSYRYNTPDVTLSFQEPGSSD